MKKSVAISFLSFAFSTLTLFAADLPVTEKSFIAKWTNGQNSIEIVKENTGLVLKLTGSDKKTVNYPAYVSNSVLFIKRPGTATVISFAVIFNDNEMLCKIVPDDSVSWKKVQTAKDSAEKKAKGAIKKLFK